MTQQFRKQQREVFFSYAQQSHEGKVDESDQASNRSRTGSEITAIRQIGEQLSQGIETGLASEACEPEAETHAYGGYMVNHKPLLQRSSSPNTVPLSPIRREPRLIFGINASSPDLGMHNEDLIYSAQQNARLVLGTEWAGESLKQDFSKVDNIGDKCFEA